jgi:hypothetical protein
MRGFWPEDQGILDVEPISSPDECADTPGTKGHYRTAALISADTDRVRNGRFPALSLLFGLSLGIVRDLLWTLLGMMHRAVEIGA